MPKYRVTVKYHGLERKQHSLVVSAPSEEAARVAALGSFGKLADNARIEECEEWPDLVDLSDTN